MFDDTTTPTHPSASTVVYGQAPLAETPPSALLTVEDPCPHGIPAHLCEDLCSDDDDAEPGIPNTDEPEPGGRPTPGARQALACHAAASAPEMLTRAALLDVCEDAERQTRWAQAVRIRMIAEFHTRHPDDALTAPPGGDPSLAVPSKRWVPDEIALALQISRHEAIGQIAMADRFTTVLPDTLGLLESGRICWRRAEALLLMTGVLPADKARQVEALVLPKAPDSTPKQLRDRIRRAIAKVDPDGEHRRHTEANTGRRVAPRSLEDGMASLWCYGSAEQIEAAWTMVDRLARSLGTGDLRTLDQRRFDLTMQILQGRITVTDPSDVDPAVTTVLAAAWTAAQDRAAHAADATDTDDTDTDDTAPNSNAANSNAANETYTNGSAANSTAANGTAADLGPVADTANVAPHVARRADHPPGTDITDAQTPPVAPPPVAPPPAAPPPWVPPDVLADALAHALTGRPDLHAVVRKPLVQVVVGLDTLLGSNRPAELLGHGPVDADTARTLAADAVIHRLVTDPLTGTVLDYGRTTYSPPAALADHVRARDQICRGPRCTRRVRDLDHHVPFGAGHDGQTNHANLHGYCLHCHLLKDVPGWNVVAGPDGTVTWISPCGRRTTTEPFDYRDLTDDLPAWTDTTTTHTDTVPAAGSPARTDDGPPPF